MWQSMSENLIKDVSILNNCYENPAQCCENSYIPRLVFVPLEANYQAIHHFKTSTGKRQNVLSYQMVYKLANIKKSRFLQSILILDL